MPSKCNASYCANIRAVRRGCCIRNPIACACAILILGVGARLHAIDAWPNEAIEGWQGIAADTEAIETTQLLRIVGKDANVESWPLHLARHGESLLQDDGYSLAEDTSARERLDTVQLQNATGRFALTKPTPEGSWQLSAAERLTERELVDLEFVHVLLAPSIRIQSCTLLELASHNEVELTHWEPFDDESGQPRIKFRAVVPAGVPKVNRGVWEIIVDPDNRYRMVSATRETDGKQRTIIRNSYDNEFPAEFPSEHIIESPESGKRSVYTTTSVTLGPPPPEIFTLAHYGIDGFAFERKSNPYYWLYVLVLLTGVILTGFAIRRAMAKRD